MEITDKRLHNFYLLIWVLFLMDMYESLIYLEGKLGIACLI